MIKTIIPKPTQLEDLVPPLELCKQIPAGEFDKCLFVWEEARDNATDNLIHEKVKHWIPSFELKRYFNSKENVVYLFYPAPTLQEIMEKIPNCRLKHKDNIFFFEQRNRAGAYAGGYNAAELALQVWLKMKGIKNDQQKNARVE
jgi:hypothetical protein